MLRDGERSAEHQLHLAGDEVVDGRRAAFVWNARDVDAGHRLEQLGSEMVRGAGIAAGVIEFAGSGFGQRDQVAHRFHRH